MEPIILIPAIVCCLVLTLASVRHAFIYVYLPAILLLPGYFVLRISHIPPISFSDTAILPLGVAIVATQMHRWRWDWMDLWVGSFALSAGMAEGLSAEFGLRDLDTLVLSRLRGFDAPELQHQ